MQFSISPRSIVNVLFVMVAFFVLAHLAFSINYHHMGYEFFGSNLLYVLFDLMGEVTIPTWYASSLLLLCSLFLAAVAVNKHKVRDRYRLHWAALSVIFLGLSIDEAADLHGAVSYKLHGVLNTSGFLAYAWVIPGAVLRLIVGMAYVRFLLHLQPPVRRRFLLAGLLFVGGALGMEVMEAAYETATGHGDSIAYLIMIAVEEAMEMCGAIVLISALLSYLGSLANVIEIDIGSR